ncbi:MAG: ABC transporter permease [Gammaproteobacteria bacterium]|jgi:putative ABC transport system permease protein
MRLAVWLNETLVVTVLNLRNIRQRLDSSLVAMIGFAGVAAVFVAVLSIRDGFRATLAATGRDDVAIVMRGGAGTEINSVLGSREARVVTQAPGIVQTRQGPLASPELLVLIDMPKRSTGTPANVAFRGVTDNAFRIRKSLTLIRGRRFHSGLDEVIVGRSAVAHFRGLELGSRIHSGRHDWTVVGVFDDGGGLHNSEIWTDLHALQAAYDRGSSVESVYAQLASPAAFPAFRRALLADPRLNVSVQRETDYFAEQSEALATFISIAGSVIALLMGGGAVFGAINTMYTAISARSREIATLRALGFGRSAVVASVLVEGCVLGLLGGLAGGLLAWAGFNGFEATTFNQFSQVAFAFTVTPPLIARGTVYAVFMGLAGGLLPAVRAARMPVAPGLRQL